MAVVLSGGITSIGEHASAKPDDGRSGGAAAVEQLGVTINQVAAKMGLRASDLVEQFLTDPTLLIDQVGQLLYVDPPQDSPTGSADLELASVATPDQAFLLHSLPGASRVIYLDFDGHQLVGTAWNNSTGGSCYADPYDSDGSPATFSDAERDAVIGIWARVAEDYRPFQIDVTTQDPGVEAIRRTSASDATYGARALVTKSTSPCPNGRTLYASVCSGGCGGVAYVGVFDYTGSNPDLYQPALIFVNGVGTGPKNIAEAAAHEVGHNLGLSHDGTSSVAYYRGHGSWAPIMGVGYYKAITQFSLGEYTGANQHQDDFVVMQSRGAPPRADDHGSTAAAATALVPTQNGTQLVAGAEGDITNRVDKDVFAQTVVDGTLTVTATPFATSPDLDIRLELRDAAGNLIAAADPPSGSISADIATGLDATLSAPVPAGTYYVTVDGVGFGSPLDTGYSDYGSVGSFTLATTFAASLDPPPTTTTTSTTTTTTTTSTTTSTTLPPTSSSSTSTTTTTTVPPNRLQAQVTVTARRAGGNKVSATATVKVTDSAATPRAVSGARVTGQWWFATALVSTRSADTDATGTAKIDSGNHKAAAGTPVKFCVTTVVKPGSTWSGGTVCSTTITP